jgi:hypothetical protein
MSRLPTKYLTTTDHCVRCPGHPTSAPDGKGPTTDGEHVVLVYTCAAGHAWQRSFRRSDLKRGPINVTAARRRHLATTTTATTINDCTDDCTERTGTARQPSPWTAWHPERRLLWTPR